jgi:hypothetical protein
VKEYAEGTCELIRAGGRDLGEKVIREEADELATNRFFGAYGIDPLDPAQNALRRTTLAQKLADWHRIYADPDAVRSAIRALADLTDEAGSVIRLSDEAIEGAVKFVAKAGDDIPLADREALLRELVGGTAAHGEDALRFVRETSDPEVVEGMAKMLLDFPAICPLIS